MLLMAEIISICSFHFNQLKRLAGLPIKVAIVAKFNISFPVTLLSQLQSVHCQPMLLNILSEILIEK